MGKPRIKPQPSPEGPESPVFLRCRDLDSSAEVTLRVSDIQSFQSIDQGTGTLIHCRNGKEYRVTTPVADIERMMV